MGGGAGGEEEGEKRMMKEEEDARKEVPYWPATHPSTSMREKTLPERTSSCT